MENTKFDITSTAIEKGIDLVAGFLEKLAGSTIEEAGLMFGDKMKVRRLKNQIKIFSDAKKIAEENNISIKQINLKALVPLLEFSSLEEDETLQQKWSNLVVNFSNANEEYESSIFPFILNQLTTKDILILHEINEKPYGINVQGIVKSNLIRLGLIDIHNPSNMTFLNRRDALPRAKRYSFTELGESFYKCCTVIN